MRMFRSLIMIAVFSSFCTAAVVKAQDSCDSSDVDAAIEQAASDNSCVADGTYISSQSLVDNLVELCISKGLGKKCRRCLEQGRNDLISALRNLARLGSFSAEAIPDVREALAASKASCAAPVQEPTPTATPEPSATPSEGEGGEHGNIADAVLHSIREGCCSKEGAEFVSCRLTTTQYGLAHGLSQGAASSILAASKSQLCH